MFYRCQTCALIIKDPTIIPTREQEVQHYAKHNNDIFDPGYRAHLEKIVIPLEAITSLRGAGLDFGCGPSESIAALIRQRGGQCASFDPYFCNQEELLVTQAYEYVTCSEVVEHFRQPAEEFNQLTSLVKVGGHLAIMTQSPPSDFQGWWYHRDPTHRVFYASETFSWLASYFKFAPVFSCGDVHIMRRIS